MKTLLISFTLGMVVLLAPINQANAVVAFSTGGNSLAVMGVFLANPMTGIASYFITLKTGCSHLCSVKIALSTMFVGLVMLDTQTNKIEFTEITAEESKKRGVSEVEREIYNGEVSELNLLIDEVAAQLDKDSTPEEAKNLWKNHKDYLSLETLSVLNKMTQR